MSVLFIIQISGTRLPNPGIISKYHYRMLISPVIEGQHVTKINLPF